MGRWDQGLICLTKKKRTAPKTVKRFVQRASTGPYGIMVWCRQHCSRSPGSPSRDGNVSPPCPALSCPEGQTPRGSWVSRFQRWHDWFLERPGPKTTNRISCKAGFGFYSKNGLIAFPQVGTNMIRPDGSPTLRGVSESSHWQSRRSVGRVSPPPRSSTDVHTKIATSSVISA